MTNLLINLSIMAAVFAGIYAVFAVAVVRCRG